MSRPNCFSLINSSLGLVAVRGANQFHSPRSVAFALFALSILCVPQIALGQLVEHKLQLSLVGPFFDGGPVSEDVLSEETVGPHVEFDLREIDPGIEPVLIDILEDSVIFDYSSLRMPFRLFRADFNGFVFRDINKTIRPFLSATIDDAATSMSGMTDDRVSTTVDELAINFQGLTLRRDSSLKVDLQFTWIGDANLDGQVDFADFVALAEGFGESGGWAQGDFDGNGEVEFPDFLGLAENFGQAASPSASVPEPSCLLLLLVGLPALIGRREMIRGVF